MSTLSLRLPNSIHQNAKIFAEREGISINQLAATALAEKLAALATESFIDARAQRSSSRAFAEAMASVPDAAPAAGDEYVPGSKHNLGSTSKVGNTPHPALGLLVK